MKTAAVLNSKAQHNAGSDDSKPQPAVVEVPTELAIVLGDRAAEFLYITRQQVNGKASHPVSGMNSCRGHAP